MIQQLNPHDAELQILYDAIPSYWQVCNEQEQHYISITLEQVYFTLIFVLLVACFLVH